MLNKSEVMMLIKEAGLDAQFRENSKNHWSDVRLILEHNVRIQAFGSQRFCNFRFEQFPFR